MINEHIDPDSGTPDSGESPESGTEGLHGSGWAHHADPIDGHSHAWAVSDEPTDHSHALTHEDVLLLGTPEVDSHYHSSQTTPFTCDQATEIGIVNEFLGTHFSEAEATYHATQHGWLTHEGTSHNDVGELLTLFGIENHRVKHAEISGILAELSLGHKVIVGVHSDELRDPGHPLHAFTEQAENHAIWVTGFDATDEKHPKVIINDSADPTGAGATYALETFLHAWNVGGYEYVATNHAPPNLAERVEGFDADTGTFSDLAADVREHDPEFLSDVGGVTDDGTHAQDSPQSSDAPLPTSAELLKGI